MNKVSISQRLAAYRAQIEMSRKEKELNFEKSNLQNIRQQLKAIFWRLKFLTDQQCLEDELRENIITRLKELKNRKNIQLVYEIGGHLKDKCIDIVYQVGRELDIIIAGAELLNINFSKIRWEEKVKSIKDEQTYNEMIELHNTLIKQRSEVIELIDQRLKLKSAREIFLKVLREGEVKLSEFSLKQIEEIIKSPLREYLSIKLSGK